ncbi:type II CRISPR-associated endonuclease Cas1 [Helicobacter macacae]|uniref:CRISPR-associated endonuclease Cas1 n=1 Tax=Helicobacter macacae MIT 99-5501 TaxID=1357400 RepID=V8C5Q4_9HELI|nr:type II CRISPR-associated endonuclease Cas1 [Helicobacter macacae]ETD22694.1 CRISPR-associated endonuclease cas1 [Helicobacter macacae MIT 99-5501]
MFDSHFRTLFISNPAHLRLESKRLIIERKESTSHHKALAHKEAKDSDNLSDIYSPYKSDKKDSIAIPLADIAYIILESPRITLSSALLDALSTHKVALISCDSSHLPSGIFTPFLGHYRSLSVLESQIALKKQTKSIIWQQIIKSKITNQCSALKLAKPNETKAIDSLQSLAKSVQLGDSTYNEAKAAAIYFKALFGNSFIRMRDINSQINAINGLETQAQEAQMANSDSAVDAADTKDSAPNAIINSALNYGYAIVRAAIVRTLSSSGLNPALGLSHANAFNPFNLADDIIEPFRAFVDSLVAEMLSLGEFGQSSELSLQNRTKLAQILSTQVCMLCFAPATQAHATHTQSLSNATNKGKLYPLMRAVIVCIQSLVKLIESNGDISGLGFDLPVFMEDISNGREIYEGASDV